jgi:hypothetical protein
VSCELSEIRSLKWYQDHQNLAIKSKNIDNQTLNVLFAILTLLASSVNYFLAQISKNTVSLFGITPLRKLIEISKFFDGSWDLAGLQLLLWDPEFAPKVGEWGKVWVKVGFSGKKFRVFFYDSE